jgi:hypothetical protein
MSSSRPLACGLFFIFVVQFSLGRADIEDLWGRVSPSPLLPGVGLPRGRTF